MSTGDSDNALLQAQGCCGQPGNLADDRAGRQRPREASRVHPCKVEDLVRPGQTCDVKGHRAGRQAVIHGRRQAELVKHEILHAQKALRRDENVRLVLPQPHQLVHRVHRVQRHPSDLEQPLLAHVLCPPAHLLPGARVDGGDEAAQRPAGCVNRHH